MIQQHRQFRGSGHAWDVVTNLVAREFKLRYRRAFFGWSWAIAQPLARLLVLTFVFTRILPLGIENYAAFLFAGLIAWIWFASGLTAVTSSPVEQGDLLFRPGLPRAGIPLVSAITTSIDYVAALPILLAFLAFSGGVHPTILFLPVVLVVQLLMIMALGYPLAIANVHFRDVRHFVEVGLVLGFYLTPVFYGRTTVPEEYRSLLDLNPMTHLIGAHRAVLVDGELPELGPFISLAVGSAVLAFVGYRLYRSASQTFVDQL